MPKSATSGPAVVEKDVLRLDVPVNHVVPVRVVERTGDLGGDANCVGDRELLFARQPVRATTRPSTNGMT